MEMAKLFVATTFALVASSIAYELGGQLPLVQGDCYEGGDLPDFKPEKFFTGRWYEYASFGNYIFQADGICRTMTSEVKGDVLNVLYYQYLPVLKKYTYLRSSTNVTDVKGSSFKLYYDVFIGLINVKVPLTVLATDYDNYAVFYSCQGAVGLKEESSWMLTRTRGDVSHLEDLSTAVTSAGLDFSAYDLQKSTGCGPNEPQM